MKALVTALVAVPFAVGWGAGAAVTALSWTWAAVRVGWNTGYGKGQS